MLKTAMATILMAVVAAVAVTTAVMSATTNEKRNQKSTKYFQWHDDPPTREPAVLSGWNAQIGSIVDIAARLHYCVLGLFVC